MDVIADILGSDGDMIGLAVKIIIGIVVSMAVGLIALIIAFVALPKNKPLGVIFAILFGPLAYIYVGKWGKAIGLMALSWFTGGIAGLFIWPYSIFNICREIDEYRDNEILRRAQLHQARALLGQDPLLVQSGQLPRSRQENLSVQPSAGGGRQASQKSPQALQASGGARVRGMELERSVVPHSGGLAVLSGVDQGRMYLLNHSRITIGRDRSNSIPLPQSDQEASRFHAEIRYEDDVFYLRDKDSTNGTFVNGHRIRGNCPLKEGDHIQIGDSVFQFAVDPNVSSRDQVMESERSAVLHPGGLEVLSGVDQGRMYPLDRSQVTIGRDKSNSIPLPQSDQEASRFHAEIRHEDDVFYLRDKDSTNGTFVNSHQIRGNHPLREGDHIQIGNNVFRFTMAN